MTARDPDEEHRAATPLELFFDLTFVVAIAQASTAMHHELVSGHAGNVLTGYPIVFFAILWAWMGFTWFASAYDTDDAGYRLAVLVQMVGILVLAAGVPRFLADLDPTVGVVGYVILRLGTVVSVLAATVAVQTAVDGGTAFDDLLSVAAGGFLIVASMWWIYFDMPVNQLLTRARRAFVRRDESQSLIWAYGHFFVFGGAAAVGAGLAVNVDQVTQDTGLTDVEAGLTVTIPLAVYLITVWALHKKYKRPGVMRDFAAPVAAVLILATSWTGEPVLATGVLLAALVTASVVLHVGPPTQSDA